MEWQASKDADHLKPKRMLVTYQGKTYWAYAGQWQKVTGNTVAAEDRAPLMISRKSPDGNDRSPPVWIKPRPRPASNGPVPPFARNESYTGAGGTDA